ncbi:zinc finger C2HC domain-containing protein 1C [Phaethornis superciliosus]
MALLPPMNSVVAATKRVPSSELKHQKDGFQHKLVPDKQESLKDLCAQKSPRYSYSVSPESGQHNFSHGDFCPAGLQSKYLPWQTKDLSAKPVARCKEGVDRAYPLKPIFHESVSVPVVNRAQLRSSPYMEEAPTRTNSRPSYPFPSKGKALAGQSQLPAELSPWKTEHKQSPPHLYRSKLACILQLEAEGEHLEREIKKKEALLREKLMRAEEELRRRRSSSQRESLSQREKELIEKEERRDREAKRAHEKKAMRHPEEKTLRVAVRQGDGAGVFREAQYAETTIPKPSTTLHTQELAVEKLKKRQLVASNSKIQDHVRLASHSELNLRHSLSPSALSDQDSGHDPPTEELYMRAMDAVEPEGLGQCSFCGRKFLCTRLEKHMSICGKNQGSKRKVYDSKKARVRGTELEPYQQQKSSQAPQDEPPKKNNWRQKHKALIETLHQARQVQQFLSKGGNVYDLPPVPPAENPDYVPCPYCKRRFAPLTAERHIPKCKNIKSRPAPPPQWRHY